MSQGLTRREFVTKGLTMVATSWTVPAFITRTALVMNNPWDVAEVASRPGVPDDRILVVVQLGGGNDGLNTVIPYTQDAYYRVRPTLAVPQKDIVRVSDELGLHPSLAKAKELYDQGAMAIVQGVGYPNPSRSHFRSMEIWQTADPEGHIARYGWIGRYFDSKCPVCEQPTVGVNVGSSMPLALQSESGIGVSLEQPEALQWMPAMNGIGATEEQELFKLLNAPAVVPGSPGILLGSSGGGTEPGTIDFLRHTAMNAYVSSERVRDAVKGGRCGRILQRFAGTGERRPGRGARVFRVWPSGGGERQRGDRSRHCGAHVRVRKGAEGRIIRSATQPQRSSRRRSQTCCRLPLRLRDSA